jgi:hypothetical protein
MQKFDFIERVIRSCITIQQLESAYYWGIEVIKKSGIKQKERVKLYSLLTNIYSKKYQQIV